MFRIRVEHETPASSVALGPRVMPLAVGERAARFAAATLPTVIAGPAIDLYSAISTLKAVVASSSAALVRAGRRLPWRSSPVPACPARSGWIRIETECRQLLLALITRSLVNSGRLACELSSSRPREASGFSTGGGDEVVGR